MSGGMEATAKLFAQNRPACPNCNRELSDSELVGQVASGPIPLCFECRAKTSAQKILLSSDKIKNRPLEISHPINHPRHYTSHSSGIECIEITRHMNYNRGVAIAYIWRADYKGSTIDDLKKAVWHLNDEIARLENQGKETSK